MVVTVQTAEMCTNCKSGHHIACTGYTEHGDLCGCKCGQHFLLGSRRPRPFKAEKVVYERASKN